MLKLIGVTMTQKRLELWTQKSEDDAVEKLLSSQWVSSSQLLVGINPGSSLRWPTKQWPVENFAKLCDELARRNVRVVITGSPEESGVAEQLMGLTRNKPVNAIGKTSITELVALIRRCQVFISSDSAPMHIASAVHVPLVAIFGPTTRELGFFPYGPKSAVVELNLPCRPCSLHGGNACPLGHFKCMNDLTPEMVFNPAKNFLEQASLKK